MCLYINIVHIIGKDCLNYCQGAGYCTTTGMCYIQHIHTNIPCFIPLSDAWQSSCKYFENLVSSDSCNICPV